MVHKISLFKAGHCHQFERLAMRKGRLKSVEFPALFAIIEHPQFGPVLFDTGYSLHMIDATRSYPYKLYSQMLPFTIPSSERAIERVRQMGYKPSDIKYIILSHFHIDHVAGVRDFPNAKLICSRIAYSHFQAQNGVRALRFGYIPSLVPPDASGRMVFMEDDPAVHLPGQYKPFDSGWDIFQDRSIYAVLLPGHAAGQIGLFLTDEKGQDWLLAADSVWSVRQLKENLLPHPMARFMIHDFQAYRESMMKIRQLSQNNSSIAIVPSHEPDFHNFTIKGS